MKTITVAQLRQHPTQALADVEAGETYVVTKHRHPVARRTPVDGEAPEFVPISDAILTVAEAPHHVRSLDAIHLATALRLGGRCVVASHDQRLLAAAQDLGLPAIDPVEEEHD